MSNVMWVGLNALISTLSDSTRIEIVTYEGDSDEPITIYSGYPTQDAKEVGYRYGIDFVNYMEVLDDGILYIEVS